jgi:hypothetical protein
LTTATAVVDEAQVADCNTCVLPSLNVPVAVNCWVVPKGIAGLAGVTVIETNAAGVAGSYSSALER